MRILKIGKCIGSSLVEIFFDENIVDRLRSSSGLSASLVEIFFDENIEK